MAAERATARSSAPVLLCFDGSEDAAAAIAEAGRVLSSAEAVVLTVWEPVSVWEPYDPATILSAPLERLAANALGLDEITKELAREKLSKGVELARQAGFSAEGRIAEGKTWRTICDVASEVDADAIVLGARGLGRVGGVLMGGVSSAVAVHSKVAVLIVPHHSRD